MQAALLKRLRRVPMIAALVLVLGLGAALAFALMSSGTHTAQAAVRHTTKHPAHHVTRHARHQARSVHHVTQHARHHARSVSARRASDPDNVQSGDQASPDNPGETSGESESSVESEQGQLGEPANGHQDTGADVNYECTGDCVQ